MEEFRRIRLGDACITNADSYSMKENWRFVNYLDTGNITNNKLDSIQRIDLSKEKLPSRARRKVRRNSIIYSTVRPNQYHFGIIKTQPENFLVSTGFVVIDVDPEMLDADFTYYWLSQSVVVKRLHAIAEQSTSAYPSIKSSDIENLEMEIPALSTQKKIADVLRALDEKIAVNEEINKNLEQQSQAIFDDMFPDIFSLNTDATLQDLIVFANGKKRPKTIGNIPVYGGNGILAYTDKSNADNCVIIGRVGAYCGNTFLCLDKCWTSDNAIQAKNRTGSSPLFIYYLLRNASLSSRHIGTGQPLMTQGILNAIPIKYPVEEKISAFIETCSPIHKMISGNRQQNESLASIRDSMLPKLMSGEMDVSELNL